MQSAQDIISAFFLSILSKPQVLNVPWIPVTDILNVIHCCYEIFKSEPSLIRLNSDDKPTFIIGDLHGNLYDLYKILGNHLLPPFANYIFLGDLVDRGEHSLEIVLIVFSLKILYPENVFLLRGNHECENVSKKSGFYSEVEVKYHGYNIFNECMITFSQLPIATILNDEFFCVHAGISEELTYVSQIEEITRPVIIKSHLNLINGIIWSDPSFEIPGFSESRRGIGCSYGFDVLLKFLNRNNLKMMIRGHECINEGYRLSFNNKLATVFSASRYCGYHENIGAIMIINQHQYEFETFSVEAELEKKTMIMPSKSPEMKKFPGMRSSSNHIIRRGLHTSYSLTTNKKNPLQKIYTTAPVTNDLEPMRRTLKSFGIVSLTSRKIKGTSLPRVQMNPT
ncbi:Serine/threonine-protein phosphatase beta isoform [Tritrichomonas foetus]|uniref:Serine/threonine-protein phosphatase n=1 Tax=Tritrichomonas foetus TaxID=1144522 RepID=A0A1J4J3T3_9EUKA|nr:Serine/threonine-protein phosphatase beta isoform [Tritrichomonas foetus]|eukprot:OHS94086.1 Serine/threonine-protein phosphatase beta isoform [Tritrichomonas foetus]